MVVVQTYLPGLSALSLVDIKADMFMILFGKLDLVTCLAHYSLSLSRFLC